MVRAILFDNDGVLVNTEPLYCESYVEALRAHGISITPEFYYTYWTRAGNSVRHFLKEFGHPFDPKEIRAAKDAILFKKLNDLASIAGVREKLEELSSLYSLALVTTSYRNVVDKILAVTDLGKYFGAIVTGDDVTKGKPDPQGFLLGAELIGISPLECVVIGDAEKDTKAAHAGNIPSIAIPNEYTRDHDFSLAYRVIPSIRELTPELINAARCTEPRSYTAPTNPKSL